MSSINKKSITDINVKDKKVLVRCDFNVPMDENCCIKDDNRITASLPTIKYLLENHAAVILCSHLGRPKNGFEDKFSLAPVAKRLSELLEMPIILSCDVIGDDSKTKSANLKSGEVLLLENVRFEKAETKNEDSMSEILASFADIFCNDAFGSAHRAHCSTTGVAKYIPAVSGLLMEKELRILGGALENPQRPMVAILGGAKVADKIGVIENLLNKADCLLIGGGMAYTFLKAQGYNIGKSLCEEDKLPLAKELIKKAKDSGKRIIFPLDTVVTEKLEDGSPFETVDISKIPENMMGVDIGTKTAMLFAEEIKKSKTVINNGPMGVFEIDNFSKGTAEIIKAMADSGAVSIIGGGDSASAAKKLGFKDKITHISTGGGASLEFMEGLELPGVAVLNEK
ncbi:MAG: phosphoglycerate kinase [Oscillospiraceae bacterium]